MKPHEPIEGFVDLQTLGKIYDALRHSNSRSDVDLGAWIKETYLYEPLPEHNWASRQIWDKEGFEKIYAAYKRARVLTDKAVAKFPFFRRGNIKMSPAIVLKAAIGEVKTSPPTVPAVRELSVVSVSDSVANGMFSPIFLSLWRGTIAVLYVGLPGSSMNREQLCRAEGV